MTNLTSELVKLGHEPIIYCESNRNSIEKINGVKLVYMKGFKSNLLCKPWVGLKATLRTLFKERKVSIIHYNAWPPSLWCFIPRLFGIKSLMHIQGYLKNNLRLPLVPASGDTYSQLQQVYSNIAE